MQLGIKNRFESTSFDETLQEYMNFHVYLVWCFKVVVIRMKFISNSEWFGKYLTIYSLINK